MYAEIPAAEVETKSPLIEENGIYVISRFRVSNVKRNFRPVASQVMVEFTFRTQVSTAREDMTGFPAYAYRLTPIDQLRSRAGDTSDFIGESLYCMLPMLCYGVPLPYSIMLADIIGLLTEVSDPYTVHLPNKPGSTLTRHIILRDLKYV